MSANVAQLHVAEPLIPLTRDEARRLKECERMIERGMDTFYEVGNALAEIRELRLYRMTHATFEDYCRQKWDMSRFYAHRLIDAAQVVDNLLPMGNIVPGNERQARELAKFEPEVQKAVWHLAVKTAPIDAEGNPRLSESHIRSLKNVLTEVVKAGGMDDGSGQLKPLGVLIDAAVTEETYERMMRQKEYIKEKIQDDKDTEERKQRFKSDHSEVEIVYEETVQTNLARYITTITEFEEIEWPGELAYFARMFQLHKAHAHFQKTRNVHEDCEQIMSVLRRLSPDADAGYEIAAQELYDWLFDLGYCMSKKEFVARLRHMSREDVRMLLLTDAGEAGKLDEARGKLPGIVSTPWSRVVKFEKKDEKKKRSKEDEDWDF